MTPTSPLLEVPPPAVALPAGTRVGGFVVDALLSYSEVAVVYRVTDPLLQRPLALKEHFPRALYWRDDTGALQAVAHAGPGIAAARQAFLDEARLLAGLDIPGLLRVSAVFEAQGTVYRVMPLHDAPTLAEARATSGAPDAQTLQRLLAGVLAPLQALHSAGLVHGAVAPDQTLWLDDARPLLLGFGAVRSVLASEPAASAAHGVGTDLEAVTALAQFAVSGQPAVAGPPRGDPPVLALVPPAGPPEPEPGSEDAVRAAIASMLESIPPAPPRPAAQPTLLHDGPPVLNDIAAPSASLHRPPPERSGAWRWALLALLGVGAAATAWQWQPWADRHASTEERATAAPQPRPVTEEAAVPQLAPAAVEAPASAPAAVADTTPPLPAPAAEVAAPVAAAVASLPQATTQPAEPAAVPPPPRAEAKPPVRTAVAKAVTPRDNCGARSNFSLYQCMQTQCRKPQFSEHAQCRTLRETGEVG